MVKRVLVLGNSCLVVFGMRGELIRRLRQEGLEVVVSFPTGSLGKEENPSEEYGCTYIETNVDRRGMNVGRDAALLYSYIKLLKEVKPDVVLTFTVKCSIYGGMACRLLKIPYIVNITGLGKGLAEGGVRQKLLVALYKIAMKSADCVFFQNRHDRQFFVDHGIRYKKDAVLPGSGVNLEKYAPLPYPADDKIIFTYVARIMKTKGIDEFLAAAEAIRPEHPHVEFHVCGFYEDDYETVITDAQQRGIIRYHGQVSDVRPYEAISHCVVLPTYHPEGVSNVLLEAAACTRPIITTNRPGCAEVVDEGVNGYLVREKDGQDLIRAMRKFMELSWEARRDMGLAGRAKVEKEFDRQIVVEKYMEELNQL
jgi:galacturonosyltransferase